MKHVIFLGLAAAILVTSGPLIAQTLPATVSKPAMSRQFLQMQSQMQQIRNAERSQIIEALTPAHKALLANIVATLATSVTPDVGGAVRRLDGALSAGEKQAILNAAQTAGIRERAYIQSVPSQNPSGGRDGGPGEGAVPRGTRTDAAIVLLRRAMPDLGIGNSAAALPPVQ